MLLTTLLLAAWMWTAPLHAAENVPATIEFNRDVRPILSDTCFTCHGPDKNTRMSPLRLDIEQIATEDRGGYAAIVPGKPDESEVIRRIISDDPGKRMPPAYAGRNKLSDSQITVLRRWIEQGARWQDHWSFIPPKRRPLPSVRNAAWPKNDIDYFVLARLEQEGLEPSPEAARATLLRRVSFDLTGLPPSPEHVDAFVRDNSPNAYEIAVDRLLQSPRYGERMAARWLDAARYADTNGYQTDAERFMWRWRDWVIKAFNGNMRFDQFTIEQIAGDLLPNATLDQIIATGFNRNHRGNGEGGIIAEEFAVEYVVDRVETTSTVWLGVTMGCARCHDHKYDPFTQKEFYQLFAYFNNIPENGKAFKFGNSPPFVKAPTDDEQRQLAALDAKIAHARKTLDDLQPKIRNSQGAWEQALTGPRTADWSIHDGLLVHFALDGDLHGKWDAWPRKSATGEIEEHKTAYPKGSKPDDDAEKKPVEPKFQEREAAFTAGRLGQAAAFDGARYIEVGDVANIGFYDEFTLAAWIKPAAADGAILARDKAGTEESGYGLYLEDGKLQLNLVLRRLDDSLRVETRNALELNRWQHVLVTYDGSRLAKGVKMYVGGGPQELHVLLDELNQPFAVVDSPLRIGGAAAPESRFQGSIDDLRMYNVALSPTQAAVVATAETLNDLAAIAPEKRTAAQAEKLRLAYLDHFGPGPVRQAWANLNDLSKQRTRLWDTVSTVMIMKEREQPGDTFLLKRGAYDQPSDKVHPAVPEVLPALPESAPNNRLGLARWLVDSRNPLTARVTANRFWQMFFGTGLVKTAEDFGSQGEWPLHPDLLDWLAVEFVESGWDVKHVLKTMVMSATYRQSSKATPEQIQKDPENRLLARGPRFRLPAEDIRDQALLISGLLVEKIGGPSAKPYQPEGLWQELGTSLGYQQDHGEGLYRRSMYSFWKRSVAPPAMVTFDAAGREACMVRANRTNTPLQALNLMNDVTYLEASRALAERMIKEGGSTPADRIAFALRLATAHNPSEEENNILMASLNYYRDLYQTDPQAAGKFLSQGEAPRDESLDSREVAAYSAVASLILNLDETITKE